MLSGPYMQIGEVATLTDLSLRTIRHYEDVGLVIPSGRSQGGFRLYVQADVERLRLVRNMKPLFTLEEIRDFLEVLEFVARLDRQPAQEQAALLARVQVYRAAVLARRDALNEQVRQAVALAGDLRDVVVRRGSHRD